MSAVAKRRQTPDFLELLDSKFLAAPRALKALDEQFPGWRERPNHWLVNALNDEDQFPAMSARVRTDGDSAQREAEALVAALPDEGDLYDLWERFGEMAASKPDRNQARLIIGVMLDGYPSGHPHNIEVYCASLFQTAADVPVATLAQACNTIGRTLRFLPSVADLVSAIEAVPSVEASLEAVNRAIDALEIIRHARKPLTTGEADHVE